MADADNEDDDDDDDDEEEDQKPPRQNPRKEKLVKDRKSRGGEAADSAGKDIAQVLATEAMPAIAQAVWDYLLPLGLRQSLRENEVWDKLLPIINIGGEVLLTRVAGGRYASLNEFRRDFFQEFRRVRAEAAGKSGQTTERKEGRVSTKYFRGELHYSNCPTILGYQRPQKGQPTEPDPKPMSPDEARALGIPFHDQCESLITREEGGSQAPERKKTGAQLLAEDDTLRDTVLAKIYSLLPAEEWDQARYSVYNLLSPERLRILAVANNEDEVRTALMGFSGRVELAVSEMSRTLGRVFGTTAGTPAAPPIDPALARLAGRLVFNRPPPAGGPAPTTGRLWVLPFLMSVLGVGIAAVLWWWVL